MSKCCQKGLKALAATCRKRFSLLEPASTLQWAKATRAVARTRWPAITTRMRTTTTVLVSKRTNAAYVAAMALPRGRAIATETCLTNVAYAAVMASPKGLVTAKAT